jgi:hypothetical protein
MLHGKHVAYSTSERFQVPDSGRDFQSTSTLFALWGACIGLNAAMFP